MSLVELMVGMLIGLIGIIIITHLYVTNDQYKRSTTGAGTAQVNGAIALYTLEREIRMAGYGINHPLALNCNAPVTPNCSPLQYYYNGNSSYPPAPPRRRAASAHSGAGTDQRNPGPGRTPSPSSTAAPTSACCPAASPRPTGADQPRLPDRLRAGFDKTTSS